MKDVGREFFERVAKVVAPTLWAPSSYHTQRATGRMLEENVELCISAGMPPHKIMEFVMNAIHNECKKRSCYPFQMSNEFNKVDVAAELADSEILRQYITFVAGCSEAQIESMVERKCDLMADRAINGELKAVDGLIYKIDSGR